jgi:hypothetical protein
VLVGLGSYVSLFWTLSAALALAGVLVSLVGWGARAED